MIGIYKITSPSNKIYIGQSTNVEFRLHRYTYVMPVKQTKLYNSFLKYGVDKHIFECVEECLIENLNERERYWQDFYNCLNEGLNCRLTETDDLSGHLSDEVKDKLSKAKLGKPMKESVRIKISNTRKGMKFSESVKRNMSNGQKGRKHSEETLIRMSKAKLGCVSNNSKPIIDVQTGQEYISIQQASEKLGIKYSKLYYYVKKGERFKYK